MELLKELGSKSWTTSTNKLTSARIALFKCNYCEKQVELPRSKGIRQKSCGSVECNSKSKSDGYNYELSANNLGNTKDNRTSNKYYSAFKEIYRLRKKELIELNINSLDNFYSIAFESYEKARSSGNKIKTIIDNDYIYFNSILKNSSESLLKKINDDKELLKKSKAKIEELKLNLELKHEKMMNNKIDSKNKILELNEYTTLKIANEISCKHVSIINKLKKFNKNKIEYFKDFEFISLAEDKREKIYSLNKNQYDLLLSSMRISNKFISGYIYIIDGGKDSYKIGIAHNVEKRFKQILSMSPPYTKLNIVYSKEIGVKAQLLESKIHMKLKTKNLHLHYEWFNLNEDMLNTVINTIDNHENFLKKINKEIIKKEEDDYQKKINERIKKEIEIIIKKNEEIYSRINESENNYLNSIQEFKNKIDIKVDIKENKEKVRKIQKIEKEKTKKLLLEKTKRTDFAQATTHGMTGTKLYISWQSMKQRSKSYNVPIEPEWIDSYDNWFCEIGNKHKEGYEFSLIEKNKGFVRNNIEIITIKESRYKNTAVSVIKCDKDGLELEEYSSAVDASKDTDKATPGHITACCRGKRNSHAGFKWKYKK